MLEKGVKGKGGKLIQRFMAAAAPGSFRPGMASAEELMAGVREQYRQRKAEDDAIRGMEYGEG
jgi:hypothetical protein